MNKKFNKKKKWEYLFRNVRLINETAQFIVLAWSPHI